MHTQTKTAFWLLGVFLVLIVSFSAFVFLSISDYAHDDFYKLLELRAIAIGRSQSEDARIPIDSIAVEKLPLERDYIFLLEPGESFISEAAQLRLPVSFFQEIVRNGSAEYANKFVFYKGLKYRSGNSDYIIVTSAENYFESHHFVYLKRVLFIAVISVFIFAIVTAFYFSRYVFKPIVRITDRVKQISSENLHLRLDTHNKNDELSELVRTFNTMLDRIETSFETQNNFISNASHELRTPLTAIIGEADVALAKLRNPAEYIDTIKIILDEAEKLDKKTQALLFLAQTGFNGKAQKFDKVRIDQLLMDVKETTEKINPNSKVYLDMSLLPDNPVKLKVHGSEQLLHLAFTNIISNGCKYSNYEPVYVSIGASDEHVIIIIKDNGIGIPHDELKYIYDPFFRASNTNNFEGYGIGLPLTHNIIRMHNGKIKVSSVINQGTIVEVVLPIGPYQL